MKKLCLIIFSFLIVQTAFNQNFLFNEDFNDFIDWKYSPDNNIGAKFKILDEVLSVNNFGTQQGEWYGPIAVKQLSSKLDVSYDDFIFSTYLISTDNIADAFGLIWIVLVDDDNTPILGVYWSDNYHVSSDDDWDTLAIYLGGRSIAGDKLKEAGTSHWYSPNAGATNETGFTALPGGYRNYDGSFIGISYQGNWWSSSRIATYANFINMLYEESCVFSLYTDKAAGNSVRCVKD